MVLTMLVAHILDMGGTILIAEMYTILNTILTSQDIITTAIITTGMATSLTAITDTADATGRMKNSTIAILGLTLTAVGTALIYPTAFRLIESYKLKRDPEVIAYVKASNELRKAEYEVNRPLTVRDTIDPKRIEENKEAYEHWKTAEEKYNTIIKENSQIIEQNAKTMAGSVDLGWALTGAIGTTLGLTLLSCSGIEAFISSRRNRKSQLEQEVIET